RQARFPEWQTPPEGGVWLVGDRYPLVEVVAELAAAAGVPQLAKRLRLNLADALAGHAELASDLFQRPAAAIFEAEAKLEHAPFAAREAGEDVFHLFPEELLAGGLGRCERTLVGEEVAKVAVLLLADWRFEGDRFLR